MQVATAVVKIRYVTRTTDSITQITYTGGCSEAQCEVKLTLERTGKLYSFNLDILEGLIIDHIVHVCTYADRLKR